VQEISLLIAMIKGVLLEKQFCDGCFVSHRGKESVRFVKKMICELFVFGKQFIISIL